MRTVHNFEIDVIVRSIRGNSEKIFFKKILFFKLFQILRKNLLERYTAFYGTSHSMTAMIFFVDISKN